jgi:hypothetical protein
MTEREYGPGTGLLKRRLWGSMAIVVVLAFVGGIVFLFDTTVSQNGEPVPGFFASGDNPPSPWIFALAAIGIVIVALSAHRLGGQKEGDE